MPNNDGSSDTTVMPLRTHAQRSVAKKRLGTVISTEARGPCFLLNNTELRVTRFQMDRDGREENMQVH